MKMIVNNKKLIIFTTIVSLIFIVLAVARYAHIDIVAKDMNGTLLNDLTIEPIKKDCLNKEGNKYSFAFVPKRDNVVGVILYGNKHKYMYSEEEATLTMNLYYDQTDNQIYSKLISVSDIKGSILTLKFDPLEDCKGERVVFELVANQDLESSCGLSFHNQNIEQSYERGTNPKVLYRVSLYNELIDSLNDLKKKDVRFYLFYATFIVTTALVIIFLVIIPERKER